MLLLPSSSDPLSHSLTLSLSLTPSLPPSLSLSRGVLKNCSELFGFTCCHDSGSKVDWTKAYELPRNFSTVSAEMQNDRRSHVKIPMPYSTSWNPKKGGSEKHGRGAGGPNGYVSSDDERFSTRKDFSA